MAWREICRCPGLHPIDKIVCEGPGSENRTGSAVLSGHIAAMETAAREGSAARLNATGDQIDSNSAGANICTHSGHIMLARARSHPVRFWHARQVVLRASWPASYEQL